LYIAPQIPQPFLPLEPTIALVVRQSKRPPTRVDDQAQVPSADARFAARPFLTQAHIKGSARTHLDGYFLIGTEGNALYGSRRHAHLDDLAAVVLDGYPGGQIAITALANKREYSPQFAIAISFQDLQGGHRLDAG